MKTRPYVYSSLIALLVLYFAFTRGLFSRWALHAVAVSTSYLLFSTWALALTVIGKKRKTKAWVFFGSGIVVLFGYLPSLQFVIGWLSWPNDQFEVRLINTWEQLYFYAPMIVSALCIYRGFSIWAEEKISENVPNQLPLQTPASRTPAAGAPVAPPPGAAGL